MRHYLGILAARIAARERGPRPDLDRRVGWVVLALTLAGIAGAVAFFIL